MRLKSPKLVTAGKTVVVWLTVGAGVGIDLDDFDDLDDFGDFDDLGDLDEAFPFFLADVPRAPSAFF